jgi:hypothetical protein
MLGWRIRCGPAQVIMLDQRPAHSPSLLRLAHYGLMNGLLAFNLFMLLRGGPTIWLGFLVAVLLATAVDEAAGEERSPAMSAGPHTLLDAMLYLTLPLIAANSLALAHLAGTGDPLGWGRLIAIGGFDLDAARAATTGFDLVGACMGLGLFLGGAAINVAHELIHRLHTPVALATGRWLLAFSCDTTFAIEHVYGHHRAIGTTADAATARRGETLWAFFVRATRDGNRGAFAHEAARLGRLGLPAWSWHNRALSWQAASVAIALVWVIVAGPLGLLLFAVCAVQGKFYLEAVDYIEHYGLVRVPGQPVEPRHSWNCYNAISNGLLYNLPRHAHHHRFAMKPYWQLEVEPDGPVMPFGYKTMIIAALVPAVWNRVIDPKLAIWDATMASEAERALLRQSITSVG